MNFDFSEKLNNFLKIIAKNAQEQSVRVFFVGGIVRDKLLNVKLKDVDILLLGNAIEFAKKLPDEIKISSIHKDFCTVKLLYQGIEIDIASTREEKYPYSGCLPQVEKVGVSIEKDVLRRDFTINSMYCEIKLVDNKIQYDFIDLVQGQKDIENKTLRVLHSNSYIDDPTRILRGLDFKYRFGFDFSSLDKKLINEYMTQINYENMSISRNLKVFEKILNTTYQDDIFNEIIKNKYYKLLISDDLNIDFNFLNNVLKFFKLTIDQKMKFYIKVLNNFSIEEIKFDSKIEYYKYFKHLNEIDLAFYFYKTKNDLICEFYENKDIKLFLSGKEVIDLGFKQGKIIGEIIDNLYLEKISNISKFNNKLDEINWIKTNYPLK